MTIRDLVRPLLTGLALAALPSLLIAQQSPLEEPAADMRRYAVEIILFRYADGVPAGNEIFPPEPPPEPTFGLPDDSTAGVRVFSDRPLAPATADTDGEDAAATPDPPLDPALTPLREIVLPANRVQLTVTPREELTLQDAYQKLERLDAYEPVLWAGWSQDALGENETPRIELRRLGNAPPEFDGTLQLYLSRFLHLVVDVTLTPRNQPAAAYGAPVARFGDARTLTGRGDARELSRPRDPRDRRNAASDGLRDSNAPGLVRLRIHEDRIVKNGDLRYFDHPRFGLLAKVTRLEESQDEPTEGAESLPAAR